MTRFQLMGALNKDFLSEAEDYLQEACLTL